MTKADFEKITIQAEDGISQFTLVPALGGMGTSLMLPFQNTPRELLYLPEHFWDLEDKTWQGGWPYCFPICGRLACKTMPLHGFGPYMPWDVLAVSADEVTIQLTETPETLKVYPYKFVVKLTYKISSGVLTCQQSVTNHSALPMPYYAGFHPYFLTPLAQKAQITVDFDPTGRKQYNEALTDIIGNLPKLDLPQSVSNPGLNEQLSTVADNKTALNFPDGLKINMQVAGLERSDQFNFVQMYTQTDKPFFCIEPWMNFPNALNHKSELTYLESKKTENAHLNINVK